MTAKRAQARAHKCGFKVKRGDVVTFKLEWQDAGDANIVFRAIEDEDGGRVKVSAELGLPFNPVQVVCVDWVATVNGAQPVI